MGSLLFRGWNNITLSQKHRFLKFLFVVAVLAVAYVALAYFTTGLPGDDTIKNLVDRFITVVSRIIK